MEFNISFQLLDLPVEFRDRCLCGCNLFLALEFDFFERCVKFFQLLLEDLLLLLYHFASIFCVELLYTLENTCPFLAFGLGILLDDRSQAGVND